MVAGGSCLERILLFSSLCFCTKTKVCVKQIRYLDPKATKYSVITNTYFPSGSSQVICGNISRALKSRRKVCELLCFYNGFYFMSKVALSYTIGWKNSRHFFIQWEVKPNPVVTHSHTFSRASRQLRVLLGVLIGSLILCSLWLARVIILVSVLRHSVSVKVKQQENTRRLHSNFSSSCINSLAEE